MNSLMPHDYLIGIKKANGFFRNSLKILLIRILPRLNEEPFDSMATKSDSPKLTIKFISPMSPIPTTEMTNVSKGIEVPNLEMARPKFPAENVM